MKTKFLPICLFAVIATGCVTNDLKPDDPKSKLRAAITTQNAGLDKNAVTAATNTEFLALEKGAVGVGINWTSGEASGTITPGQNFKIGQSTCRRYQRSVQSNGATNSSKLTACKGDDGIWVPFE